MAGVDGIMQRREFVALMCATTAAHAHQHGAPAAPAAPVMSTQAKVGSSQATNFALQDFFIPWSFLSMQQAGISSFSQDSTAGSVIDTATTTVDTAITAVDLLATDIVGAVPIIRWGSGPDPN